MSAPTHVMILCVPIDLRESVLDFLEFEVGKGNAITAAQEQCKHVSMGMGMYQ